MARCSVSLSFITLILFCFSSHALAHPVTELARDLENRHGGHIGIAVMDTSNQSLWDYRGNTRFPLMSTFKTLACAKLLADADQKKQKLTTEAMITRESLVTYSPVTEPLTGQRITLEQACDATMTTSDNTAANLVLTGIGGPQQLTDFLRSTGDTVTRLDRIEPELNEAKQGDLRDSTTPLAMADTLNQLILGNTLSDGSRAQLKTWMMGNQVADNLLRSVLPEGWSIADRSGAGGHGSRGITAIIWSEKRLPLIISIYMTGTNASFEERNQIIVKTGEAVFNHFGIQ
ncbi:class A beta-lactamase [Endozoicomonas elysicola]|uniref:Beta-lactamase n=1 Tax=Endozoicomonas elysicola TaxID=305900 RepID=A0A081KB33_9GAMM|nr:class A beta-lactamase [Endozoicomonas elysicola]KEI71359.1 beta-lactamase [Endozoicomonas elysicola]